MSNSLISPARSMVRIHPALDFTEDTAFIGVGLPPATGNTFSSQAIVMTSEGRVIPWNEDSFLENDIVPISNCQVFLEPRWSLESIHAFQSGVESPATAETFQNVRCYLQKYLGLRHPAEYDLVTLWIMGTYLKPLFQCYPILFFNSPLEELRKL